MTATAFNLVPAIPELIVLAMALLILMVGVFFPRCKSLPFFLSQLTLIVVTLVTWYTFYSFDVGKTTISFSGNFILDPLATFLKIFIYVTLFFTFIYSYIYNQDRKIPVTEFHVLSLLTLLGMMVLVSSHSLLTLYLGVELVSLATYAMVAMQRNKVGSAEASIKYFVVGALASAMLLYGMSMVFGASHSLNFAVIAHRATDPSNLIFVLGLIFVMVGIAFKLGAAPLHVWVPDVYQGAPTSVTLIVSTGVKISAFAMIIRLLTQAMPGLHMQWQDMLIVLSILSMLIGNLAALLQTNIKRLLAYSTVAQIGYMLLGIVAGTAQGYSAAMFFIVTYAIVTVASFGVLTVMSHSGFECENISDFAGLSSRSPLLALLILILMFSLTGVPPLVGFIAKVSVLEALIQAHFVWLAVVALCFIVISAYYYIRVVKIMYFDKSHSLAPLVCSPVVCIALSLNVLFALVVGIFPGWLFTITRMAFS